MFSSLLITNPRPKGNQSYPKSPLRASVKYPNKRNRTKYGCFNCRGRCKRCSWVPPNGQEAYPPVGPCDSCVEQAMECLGGSRKPRFNFRDNNQTGYDNKQIWNLMTQAMRLHRAEPTRNQNFLSFRRMYEGTGFVPTFPEMYRGFPHLPIWEPTLKDISTLVSIAPSDSTAAVAEGISSGSDNAASPYSYSSSPQSSPEEHLSQLPQNVLLPQFPGQPLFPFPVHSGHLHQQEVGIYPQYPGWFGNGADGYDRPAQGFQPSAPAEYDASAFTPVVAWQCSTTCPAVQANQPWMCQCRALSGR